MALLRPFISNMPTIQYLSINPRFTSFNLPHAFIYLCVCRFHLTSYYLAHSQSLLFVSRLLVFLCFLFNVSLFQLATHATYSKMCMSCLPYPVRWTWVTSSTLLAPLQPIWIGSMSLVSCPVVSSTITIALLCALRPLRSHVLEASLRRSLVVSLCDRAWNSLGRQEHTRTLGVLDVNGW